jgi:hypothetical protein
MLLFLVMLYRTEQQAIGSITTFSLIFLQPIRYKYFPGKKCAIVPRRLFIPALQ